MISKNAIAGAVSHENYKWIDSLVYRSVDEWVSLPAWASFYLELGAALSHYSKSDTNFVIAITVPTRAFATSLIASGVIVQRVKLPSTNSGGINKDLESLKPQTPVLFRKGGKQYKGIFIRIIECGGKKYLSIRYEKNSEISIPIENASKIEILGKDSINLPKSQSGREIIPPNPLVTSLFTPEIQSKFVTESFLECVVVGQLNAFQQELCAYEIAYKLGEEKINTGVLMDLVRPRGSQFYTQKAAYRSIILPASGRYSPQVTARLKSYVTIFDTCLGFIKWHSSFQTNCIAVLDKTDRNYETAIKAINEDYIQKRVDKRSRTSLPHPPPGIELMFYEVKV